MTHDQWQTRTQTHLDAFLRGHHQQVTRGKNTKRSLLQEKNRVSLFLWYSQIAYTACKREILMRQTLLDSEAHILSWTFTALQLIRLEIEWLGLCVYFQCKSVGRVFASVLGNSTGFAVILIIQTSQPICFYGQSCPHRTSPIKISVCRSL